MNIAIYLDIMPLSFPAVAILICEVVINFPMFFEPTSLTLLPF